MEQVKCTEMPSASSSRAVVRPQVRGKFIFLGEHKLYIKGVTYGTFRPDNNGDQYPEPAIVEQDFTQMVANGINAIRTYTVPPRWLLDIAQKHRLWVMVGLPWESHITFLDNKRRTHDIERRLSAAVRLCKGHPAILCYSVGNEIPAPIVRWHGRRCIELFLKRLYHTIKSQDPGALVTYVNYPTTEYLQLPFIDFLCFNVFLESPEKFGAYISRLQSIAGDRPLVMTELGLDSRRHGEEPQADSINWQVRTAFTSGCAGVFVFSWTDSWYRGGYDIEDWDFGLTRRDRSPKTALSTVSKAFAEVPFPDNLALPRISVVVCSYNGARTIRDCFEGLLRLDYPNYEVIVVDDGSKDTTANIAREYDFHLLSTENKGLSSARNTGMKAASGDIVAYIDDDAFPDPQWLKYLAATFMSDSYAGVGGPNIAPPNDPWVAQCVANAPGGPVPVLLSDREAEHIAGCNMAFRKSCLEAIGGFDPQFRTAGDDVDICWRLLQQGWKLGYSPAAMVWHHRRNSVRVYLRQQVGYGKAEAILERKWPEKYNASGHVSWVGRLYGKGITHVLHWSRERIYHGIWGAALFQSLYQPTSGGLRLLPLMPEWYLIILILAVLSAFGALWTPLLVFLPLLTFVMAVLLIQISLSGARASFPNPPQSLIQRLKLHGTTAFLYFVQPIARLQGRLENGLTPWRNHSTHGFSWPRSHTHSFWFEKWQTAHERLKSLEATLRTNGSIVIRGGSYDRWDLEIRGGMLSTVRMLTVIEEHGDGKQLLRFRSWPKLSGLVIVLILLFGALCTGAALDQAWSVSAILGGIILLIILRTLYEGAIAASGFVRAIKEMDRGDG